MIHRHKWELRGAENIVISYFTYGLPGEDKDRITRILYTCTVCDKVKTKEIDGFWTLEQLRA